MEFVVDALQEHLGLALESAVRVMLQVHHEGRAIAGRFPLDVSMDKAERLCAAATQAGHPRRSFCGEPRLPRRSALPAVLLLEDSRRRERLLCKRDQMHAMRYCVGMGPTNGLTFTPATALSATLTMTAVQALLRSSRFAKKALASGSISIAKHESTMSPRSSSA